MHVCTVLQCIVLMVTLFIIAALVHSRGGGCCLEIIKLLIHSNRKPWKTENKCLNNYKTTVPEMQKILYPCVWYGMV